MDLSVASCNDHDVSRIRLASLPPRLAWKMSASNPAMTGMTSAVVVPQQNVSTYVTLAASDLRMASVLLNHDYLRSMMKKDNSWRSANDFKVEMEMGRGWSGMEEGVPSTEMVESGRNMSRVVEKYKTSKCEVERRYKTKTSSVRSQCLADMTMVSTVASRRAKDGGLVCDGDRVAFCKIKQLKRCLVCGDRALGFNFSVITCESCKAFFRRNAFKDVNGRCQGECEITRESRSYCKRCRLQKCFNVGMRRDFILSDLQKATRSRNIILTQKRKQWPLDYSERTWTWRSMEESSTWAGSCPRADRQYVSPSLFDDRWSTAQYNVVNQFKMTPTMTSENSDRDRRPRLEARTCELLNEMVIAFGVNAEGSSHTEFSHSPSSADFFYLADTSTCLFVGIAMKLHLFRTLNEEDQVSLLKGAVIELLVLRSSQICCIQSSQTNTSSAVGREEDTSALPEEAAQFSEANSSAACSPESISFIAHYRRFLRSLLAVTRQDHIILKLLKVMILFSPDRVAPCSSLPSQCLAGGTGASALVSGSQELYAAVLCDYVTVEYPSEPRMFARLLQILTDIRDLSESHSAMLTTTPVCELQPVIRRIFGMTS